MKTFWCLFLLIICSLFDYSCPFPSNNLESIQELANNKVTGELTSELCQNVLKLIIDKLNGNEDFYQLLWEKGTRANDWTYATTPLKEWNWCMVEGSPIVYFSWNSKESCIDLKIFDEADKGITTRHICEDETNRPSIPKVTETLSEAVRTKRSPGTKNTYAFVNIAKEWKRKSCSNPVIEIYMNGDLLYSNATSEDENDDPPKEMIAVNINVKSSYFSKSPVTKTKKNYTFISNAAAFPLAKQDCFDRNMRLLTIKNEDENKDIEKAMKEKEHETYWTSGNKIANQKTWRWADSEKIMYTHWSSGEPNNEQGNEYCIELSKAGTWNDNVCDFEYPYICETVETQKDAQKMFVKIFVDKQLVFQTPSEPNTGEDQTQTVSIDIGMDGNNQSDHTTLVLFKKKNSSMDSVAASGQVVIPTNFKPDEFNGIDFVVEIIKEKDFSCPKNYYFHLDPEFTHSGAQEFCRNRSMQLVSIQDGNKHLEIEKEILKRNLDHFYWTSGYLDDGTWYWSKEEKLSYTNWNTGEPSNIGGNEMCIEIYVPLYDEAKWNDQDCQDKNPVICESLD